MVKKTHADQRYIIGLVNNDTAVINEIYTRCAGKIKSWIVFNNGTADDAADVFQEALMDVYRQGKYKSLELSCPFEPFLLLICKRKWLNEIKKKSILPVTNQEEDLLHIGEDTFAHADELENQAQQSKIFLEAFGKLGERCKEIITWSMKGEAQEKVAEALGVTYGYLRKKKSECMASLMKMVQLIKIAE
ncbi:RNA polymerase sigma factor [Pedobacter sp. MC2016-24]|uniref:RNA polymerase sigma factor n=1 Tax=Pedobacter sp. MC2016-24 TaxID=2780090 RepID=UPI0018806AF9|nr:sigma-70 family RNA polymerase sigma factor [Pedobacter sp. MC2016-24]MBE9602119.1 sigma-70 family RNA polymerase sigma factor [Pedobacter sp. MC2016-24]